MKPVDEMSIKLDRYKRFYNSKEKGNILIVANYKTDDTIDIDLRDFDFSSKDEHKRYWDVLIENTERIMEDRRGLDDDLIYGITLHYGFGAFGMVFCDTDISFTDNTSYMHPVLDDWGKLRSPLYNKDRFWSEIFIEAGRYISEMAAGRFMVKPFPSPSPLDVANLLRGNELFTDYYEHPYELKKLLELAVPAILENYFNIHEAINNPWGGTFTFGKWIPSGILILEDAADMSSPTQYQEFGAPYTSRVINAAGGAYIHHHSLAPHQYKNIAGLNGVWIEQISSDPRPKRPVTDLGYLLSQVGDIAVDIECVPEEVYMYIDELRKGRFILTVSCSNRDEAEEVISFVRDHSKIK
ncbi:hypothetical protein Mahau_2676 [Mahella australiensis 50-1 BON]|uniref:Uroporphyrinogen decarboxylase (URO-D) domain-containing protein n=2 Tax=Mahella TaxID=252965 RepID=F3ZYP4_MAHA5|nr:hypothetical protein Mahau_2676 [Mahella australiensis 50-1 BON]